MTLNEFPVIAPFATTPHLSSSPRVIVGLLPGAITILVPCLVDSGGFFGRWGLLLLIDLSAWGFLSTGVTLGSKAWNLLRTATRTLTGNGSSPGCDIRRSLMVNGLPASWSRRARSDLLLEVLGIEYSRIRAQESSAVMDRCKGMVGKILT